MMCVRFLLPMSFMIAAALLLWCPLAAEANPANTERARQFLKTHESRIRPLEVAAAHWWWNANITGRDEDFKEKERAQNRIDEALADRNVFQAVKQIRDDGGIDDPILARAM